jgi:hypothetical protein
MKRVVIGVVVLAVVGVAIGIYVALRNLDAIVAAAIEKYGTAMTGTAVRVGGVAIDLRGGKGTIRGVTIGNPSGFESAHAFRLGEITLDLDVGSLRERDPVRIEAVLIRAPEVTYELNAAGRSNLQAIQDNLKRYGGGGASESGAPAEEGAATRLAIQRFVFEEGRVSARTAAVGGKDASLALPPLRMTDLGGARGATGAEIGRSVLSAYTQRVLKTVASSRLDRVIDEKLGGPEGESVKKLLRGVLD